MWYASMKKDTTRLGKLRSKVLANTRLQIIIVVVVLAIASACIAVAVAVTNSNSSQEVDAELISTQSVSNEIPFLYGQRAPTTTFTEHLKSGTSTDLPELQQKTTQGTNAPATVSETLETVGTSLGTFSVFSDTSLSHLVPTASGGTSLYTGILTTNTSDGLGVPTIDRCACRGAFVAQKCFGNDIVSALAARPNGSDLVTVVGEMFVATEIPLNSSLVLKGDHCGSSQRPAVVATMEGQQARSIFRIVANNIVISFLDINFKRESGDVSAVRAPEFKDGQEDDATVLSTSFSAKNCAFSNFYSTTMGGSAIFLHTVVKLEIEQCTFDNNTVDTAGEIYGGGGALWIYSDNSQSRGLVSKTTFSNNQHKFGHGLGAAMAVTTITGTMIIADCEFYSNKAPGGGALYIYTVQQGARLTVSRCLFSGNEAKDWLGWGSRGGAMWVQDVYGVATINGEFDANVCETGRGGAIAANRIGSGASVTIGGVYFNNYCAKGGAVYDLGMKSFTKRSSFTISAGTVFRRNANENGDDIVVRLERLGQDPLTMTAKEYKGNAKSF